ncbi:MAG: hypothetical protein PVJ42_01325 [bacterium]|jgi:hypothetical protein
MRKPGVLHFILVVLAGVTAGPRGAPAAVPDAAQPARSIFVSLYVAPGLGLSLDAKYWERLGIGASFTAGKTPIYPGSTGSEREDEDIVLEAYADIMLASSPGSLGPRSYGLSLLGGVWFDENVKRPLLGLCGTYWVDDRVIIRGNAVYGPSAGIEFAYVLTRNFEATLTVLSGRGMLGLRFGLVEPHQFTHDLDDFAAAP